jgi:hypothetical protein
MLKVVPKQLKAKPFTSKEKKPLADLSLSSNSKNVLNNHLNTSWYQFFSYYVSENKINNFIVLWIIIMVKRFLITANKILVPSLVETLKTIVS